MNLLRNTARNELSWLNEPEKWSFTSDEGISLIAPPSSDFFCDPAGVNVKDSAPFLYKELHGDFQITTKTRVSMVVLYDSSCLMLRLDQANWAKLCFEFDGKSPSIVSVVTKDGLSDDCNHFTVDDKDAYLRIVKIQKAISMFYSKDGVEWKLVRYFGFISSDQFKVGIVAQSPVGSGTQAHFSSLDVIDPAMKNRF